MKPILIALLLVSPSLGADLWPFGGNGGNATKIRGVNVKSSLGCTDGQVLTYVAANTQFECTTTSGTGDVGGAPNLTTVGAIPYVSASGVLSQDGSFLRSAAGRYTIYDSGGSGVTTLTVRAGAGQSSTALQAWVGSDGSTGPVSITPQAGGNGIQILGVGASVNGVRLGPGSQRFGSNGVIGWANGTENDGLSAGLKFSSANNLGITNGSSTTYWTLGAGGILAGADNSIDIGASGANRPRAIYVAGAGTFGGALTAGGGASITGGNLSMNGNGISAVGALNYIANVSLPIGNVTHTTTISGGANVRIAPTYNTSGTGIAFTDFLINRTETSLGTSPGSQYLLDAQVGGTSKFSVSNAGVVTAASDFIGSSTSCLYLGATGTDGSWRFCRSGNDLVVSRRESGTWNAKGTWAP